MAKGQKALLTQFAEGLKALGNSGEYRRIYEKWLGVYRKELMSFPAVLRYSAFVVIPLLMILFAAFLWSWALRRQVAEKTGALRASEKYQRAMIACSPVALYTVDLAGNVLTWNSSAERIFGWRAAEITGKPVPIVPEAKRREFDALRKQALEADLTEVLNAARHSADITRQLLAFVRRQTIDPKVIDLNKTVEGMLKMLRRFIGEDIDLSWRPGTGRMPVFMDPSQIDQLPVNLCANARDAIRGVGRLTIETGFACFDRDYCADHAGIMPGDFIMLAVIDDGCGMDKDTMKNIFKPFFITKSAGEGTGLGLSTVFGIVTQNDGVINVYSEPGKGATFKIYLPFHIKKTGPITTQETAYIPAGRGETVLIVEDEPSILKLAQRILERLEYNVIAHRGVLDEGVNFIQKPFSHRDLAVKVREALKL